MMNSVATPPSFQRAMSEWGPRFLAEARAVGGTLPPRAIYVGTDCSGIETPIMALQAMGVQHTHEFSSEIRPRVRKFIELNFASASSRGTSNFSLSDDMLKRPSETLPDVDLYVCGFPCKPFSKLHCNRTGLKDKNARPFFKLLNVLRVKQPSVAVLENVLGIKNVLKTIMQKLRGLGLYEVLTAELNPLDMGEPVARPRMFFILIRKDRAVADVADCADRLLGAIGQSSGKVPLSARLLDVSPGTSTSARKRPGSPAFASSQGQAPKRSRAGQHRRPDDEWMTDRQRSVHSALLSVSEAQRRVGEVDKHVVDLSQSIGRTRLYFDRAPVVTPGGRIWINEKKRFMSPAEKVAIHMVPIHALQWPDDLTAADVSDMGGNTMHVMAVATSVVVGSKSSSVGGALVVVSR